MSAPPPLETIQARIFGSHSHYSAGLMLIRYTTGLAVQRLTELRNNLSLSDHSILRIYLPPASSNLAFSKVWASLTSSFFIFLSSEDP